MLVKAMYNNIAGNYEIADLFGSVSKSHKAAIEQIKNADLGKRNFYKILDLGVGNGVFLKQLQNNLPNADYTGIDVSKEMLKRANEALLLTTIETNATEACNYLPHHSQDLVIAHFINAYIPINALFNQAKLLTRANGYFSLITTTYESFPVAQQYLAEFIAKDSLLSRIVGHYYKSVLKNTTVATSLDELLLTFSQHDFEVIEHTRLNIPIKINNINELALFGIEGTWFLNTLSIRMLPKHFLLERLKRLFNKIFTFPYEDTHVIDIILAKK